MMREKVVMITGASSGIGLETASQIASLGSTVIMVSRNSPRGRAALLQVQKKAAHGKVYYLPADLSEPESIQELMKTFHRQFKRLDILINNAGAWFPQRSTNSLGWEMTLALNHMGPFLLTRELVPTLLKLEESLVINLSSAAHGMTDFSLENLNWEEGPYKGFKAYGLSKLFNILHARKLHEKLNSRGLSAQAVHPGFIKSGFGSTGQKSAGTIFFGILAALFAKSPAKGAATPFYLATSPETWQGSSRYWSNKREQKPSIAALDDSNAQALWDYSMKLAGLKEDFPPLD